MTPTGSPSFPSRLRLSRTAGNLSRDSSRRDQIRARVAPWHGAVRIECSAVRCGAVHAPTSRTATFPRASERTSVFAERLKVIVCPLSVTRTTARDLSNYAVLGHAAFNPAGALRPLLCRALTARGHDTRPADSSRLSRARASEPESCD